MATEGLHIDFERSGGFAGLSLKASVDADNLPLDQAGELDALLRAADFFSLPERPAQPGSGADRFQYDITVTQGGRRHSVSIGESGLPPALRPLIDRLTDLARKG